MYESFSVNVILSGMIRNHRRRRRRRQTNQSISQSIEDVYA